MKKEMNEVAEAAVAALSEEPSKAALSVKSPSGIPRALDAAKMDELLSKLDRWARSIGAERTRIPCLEKAENFRRTMEQSDAARKEMFETGDGFCLRPEGTVLALKGWLGDGGGSPRRMFYSGPMFRNERAQAGRFKEFYQFGVEFAGESAGVADSELAASACAFLDSLGLSGKWRLRANALGTLEERSRFEAALGPWLLARADRLCEDDLVRARGNPLRFLDSKDPAAEALKAEAPRLEEFLGAESSAQWEAFKSDLKSAGVAFEEDFTLVRGLDYYNGPVYEWTTFENKAQNAVGGGGRYDDLGKAFGFEKAPCCGMAFGVERLMALLPGEPAEAEGRFGDYVVWGAPEDRADALALAARLRAANPDSRARVDAGGRKMGRQFQEASRLGFRRCWIVGSREKEARCWSVKDLETGVQSQAPWEDFDAWASQGA